MNFIEQLDIKAYQYYMTEKNKELRKLYPEIINDIVKLCVAETAKEILEYGIPNAMTSMDTSGEMKNRCKDLITQAEKTE